MLHGLAAYTLLHHVKKPVLGTLLLSLTWLTMLRVIHASPWPSSRSRGFLRHRAKRGSQKIPWSRTPRGSWCRRPLYLNPHNVTGRSGQTVRWSAKSKSRLLTGRSGIFFWQKWTLADFSSFHMKIRKKPQFLIFQKVGFLRVARRRSVVELWAFYGGVLPWGKAHNFLKVKVVIRQQEMGKIRNWKFSKFHLFSTQAQFWARSASHSWPTGPNRLWAESPWPSQ